MREHPKTGVYVQGLSQHIVESYSDIEELLNRGNANRTTASTNMNDTSSRSHAIFTLKFSQVRHVYPKKSLALFWIWVISESVGNLEKNNTVKHI